MKLTDKALEAINTPKTRVQLAAALGHTEQWIIRLIDMNKENGTLTTAKALQVIQHETGLIAGEILEEVGIGQEK